MKSSRRRCPPPRGSVPVADTSVAQALVAEEVSAHPAVRAWNRAGGGRAPSEVRVLRYRRGRKEVYCLTAAGPDRSPVIAKRAKRTTIELEDRVYRDLLPQMPVPAIACWGRLDEADDFGWLFLEYLADDRYRPSAARDRAAAGRWLGDLHGTAACVPGVETLPDRGPGHYREILRCALNGLARQVDSEAPESEAHGVLEVAATMLQRLDEHWHDVEDVCDVHPRTLVHGDFARPNLRVRSTARSRSLRAFDWAECGFGSPAIDLARARDPRMRFAANPSIRAYRQAAARHGRELPVRSLQRLSHVGTVLRCVNAIYWEARHMPQADTPVHKLQAYGAWLHEARLALGWEAGA
jgi:aminoglycoside phosphotransferase (APT) family kinase protein